MKKILYYTMHMNKKVLTPTQGLQKIVENVFVELNMLEKSAAIVRHRNFHGSFFLNNLDVTKIEERTSKIRSLSDFLKNEVFTAINKKTPDKPKNFLPIDKSLDEKIKIMHQEIATLSDKDLQAILDKLLKEKIKPLLETQKDNVLAHHAYNPAYFFTFISKIIQIAKNTLGLKTSSQKLIEESAQLINDCTVANRTPASP